MSNSFFSIFFLPSSFCFLTTETWPNLLLFIGQQISFSPLSCCSLLLLKSAVKETDTTCGGKKKKQMDGTRVDPPDSPISTSSSFPFLSDRFLFPFQEKRKCVEEGSQWTRWEVRNIHLGKCQTDKSFLKKKIGVLPSNDRGRTRKRKGLGPIYSAARNSTQRAFAKWFTADVFFWTRQHAHVRQARTDTVDTLWYH